MAPFGSLPPLGAFFGKQLLGGPGHTSTSPHTTGANAVHLEGPSDSHSLLPPVLPSGLPPCFTGSAASGVTDLNVCTADSGKNGTSDHAGHFVEMRDLLYDNIAVRHHFEDLHRTMGKQLILVLARPRVREDTSLPTWVCSFLTFLAVGTSDQLMRDKLICHTSHPWSSEAWGPGLAWIWQGVLAARGLEPWPPMEHHPPWTPGFYHIGTPTYWGRCILLSLSEFWPPR